MENVQEQLRQKDGQLRQMTQQLTNAQGQLQGSEGQLRQMALLIIQVEKGGGGGKKLKRWYIWSVPRLTVRPNMYEQKH